MPIGDFFGSVWQQQWLQSAYFGCSNDTFFTRFPMPYEKSARIELVNLMPFPVFVLGGCRGLSAGLLGFAPRLFSLGLDENGPGDVGQPHRVLQTSGRGRYAGMILSVASMDKSWWLLEGDESIRVDNESFRHGTGA